MMGLLRAVEVLLTGGRLSHQTARLGLHCLCQVLRLLIISLAVGWQVLLWLWVGTDSRASVVLLNLLVGLRYARLLGLELGQGLAR